jgi:cell division topological specificity factor
MKKKIFSNVFLEESSEVSMADWFMRVSKRARSAKQAKDRLKLVLIHDRTNLTPDILEKLKVELLEVISRHVAINSSAVKIKVTQNGREQRLVADIPLLTIKQQID